MKQLRRLHWFVVFAFTVLGIVLPSLRSQDFDPTKGQLFHTRESGGGLIEGACVDVTENDFAVVKMTDGSSMSVPLELFEDGEQQAIRTRFNATAPDEPLTGTATDRSAQHPWHSFRGGIMCYGKIVSVHDGLMKVVNNDGKLFRIPMGMLASGALLKAEKDISQLDPSLVTASKKPDRSSPKRGPSTNTRSKPGQGADSRATKTDGSDTDRATAKPLSDRTDKAPSGAPAQPDKTTPSDPNVPAELSTALDKMKEKTGPTDPSSTKDAAVLGNLRRWRDPAGQILATGKFRRRTDPSKLMVVDDQEEQEIDFSSLSNDDKQYVQIVEAGARIEIAADSAAIKREIPADKLRTWKMMASGIPLATGEFVEMKNGNVTIFQADQRTKDLPFEMLSESDRQYAEAMASGEGPGKAPEGAIVINSDEARITPSLDGKSLLLVDGNQLKLLSADGKNVRAVHQLPANATKVVERLEYYVVAADKSLILLDKETFDVVGTHELWKFQKIHDVVLHPKRKEAFLSVENATDEIRMDNDERNRVVLVNETTGKVNMLDHTYARWLLVDPSGDFLFTGYKGVDERFGGLHFNPGGSVIVKPKWENTDILRRYRIKKDKIELDQEFPNAGANGQGLVMSANGKQISYLSFTGYPTMSYNISLLDAKNFDKKPITLATKDVANCKRLAIHPTKPLAASSGRATVVLFDTRSGKALSKQPEIPAALQGCAVHELVFSGDGQHLIVQASKGGGERFVASIRMPSASSDTVAQGATSEPAEEPEGKRLWTDKTGKFKVEAEFAGMKGDNVRLKKEDGSVIEVPLSKLTPKDQAIARKLSSEE